MPAPLRFDLDGRGRLAALEHALDEAESRPLVARLLRLGSPELGVDDTQAAIAVAREYAEAAASGKAPSSLDVSALVRRSLESHAYSPKARRLVDAFLAELPSEEGERVRRAIESAPTRIPDVDFDALAKKAIDEGVFRGGDFAKDTINGPFEIEFFERDRGHAVYEARHKHLFETVEQILPVRDLGRFICGEAMKGDVPIGEMADRIDRLWVSRPDHGLQKDGDLSWPKDGESLNAYFLRLRAANSHREGFPGDILRASLGSMRKDPALGLAFLAYEAYATRFLEGMEKALARAGATPEDLESIAFLHGQYDNNSNFWLSLLPAITVAAERRGLFDPAHPNRFEGFGADAIAEGIAGTKTAGVFRNKVPTPARGPGEHQNFTCPAASQIGDMAALTLPRLYEMLRARIDAPDLAELATRLTAKVDLALK